MGHHSAAAAATRAHPEASGDAPRHKAGKHKEPDTTEGHPRKAPRTQGSSHSLRRRPGVTGPHTPGPPGWPSHIQGLSGHYPQVPCTRVPGKDGSVARHSLLCPSDGWFGPSRTPSRHRDWAAGALRRAAAPRGPTPHHTCHTSGCAQVPHLHLQRDGRRTRKGRDRKHVVPGAGCWERCQGRAGHYPQSPSPPLAQLSSPLLIPRPDDLKYTLHHPASHCGQMWPVR